jgi:predicted ester cyclase
MSADANKTFVSSFYADMNRGDSDVIDQYFSPEVICYTGGSSEPVRGLEANKQMDAYFRSVFSDIRYTVQDIIADGDTVAVRRSWSMKHTGAFMGIAPTGKVLSGTAIDIMRIVGGKIVEQWTESDNLNFMQQLGAIPAGESQEG